MIHPLILLAIFIVCTLVGYFIISKVPSLLHTPLMSGMNALSGVTIVGALAATARVSAAFEYTILAQVLGALAIVFATINVVGGFGITHRMLRMFKRKKNKK